MIFIKVWSQGLALMPVAHVSFLAYSSVGRQFTRFVRVAELEFRFGHASPPPPCDIKWPVCLGRTRDNRVIYR